MMYGSAGFVLPPSKVSFSMMALLHVHCCEYGANIKFYQENDVKIIMEIL